MLELGNTQQIRESLEGKTGLLKEYEDDLIKRISIIEKEQDENTEFPPASKATAIIMIVASVAGVVCLLL